VCRQAGYFEHASYLAKKYDRHEDYLRIQIEDAGHFADALAYLRKLGPEAVSATFLLPGDILKCPPRKAESNLARYGRAMLHSLPAETTQLLIDLCTSSGPLLPVDDSTLPSVIKAASTSAAPTPSYLSYLALNRGTTAATVVSSETATPPSPSIKTVRDNASRRGESIYESSGVGGADTPPSATAPTGRGGGGHQQQPSSANALAGLASATLAPPPVKRLSPRIYFPHFVDHMEQFIVFLETVALRRWGQSVDDQKPGSIGLYSVRDSPERERLELSEDEELLDRMDQVAVWNTLLELYLTLPVKGATNGNQKFDQQVMRDKALRVLRNDSIPHDTTHALILCSTHNFTIGLVLLYERMGMYEDVLRFWMDKHKSSSDPGASGKVIEHLMQYGPDHPQLYPLVLRFLTSTPDLLQKHQQDVKEILHHIDEEGLMPPLGVIQVLSRNGVASVGLVKEWLVKRIQESRMEIQNV